jgi:peroxiredoxin
MQTSLDGLLTRRFAQNFLPIPAAGLPIGAAAPPFELLNVGTGSRVADAELRQRGVEILLISSTDPAQSQVVQQDLGLNMPLLSDSSCRSFRLYQTGQALGAPLPAQFLLDATGRVRFRHLFSFIEPNASLQRLLSALDTLP